MIPVTHRAFGALFLASLALAACGSSPQANPITDGGVPALDAGPDAAALPALGCLPVKAWAAPAAKAPLPVTPKFLWRKKLLPYDLTAITGLVVRSGKQIAFSYHQLYVFDLSGNPVWETRYPGAHFSSGGVVADSDGNYYQFADQLYSYFPDGRLRWSKTYPNMFRGADTFAYVPIVRGNTDLFFRSSDGKLRRVDAKTGKTIWERDLPREPLAITAFGGHIFDYVGHAWNSETGDGFSVAIDGSPFVPFAALPDGNVWGAVGRLGSYGKARLTLVNSCLAPLRASSNRVLAVPGSVVVADRLPGDRLFAGRDRPRAHRGDDRRQPGRGTLHDFVDHAAALGVSRLDSGGCACCAPRRRRPFLGGSKGAERHFGRHRFAGDCLCPRGHRHHDCPRRQRAGRSSDPKHPEPGRSSKRRDQLVLVREFARERGSRNRQAW